MISSIGRAIFISFSLVVLSSWSNNEEETQPLSSQEILFNEKQFFRDAYNYRIKNNLEIPSHYYTILEIKKPQPLDISILFKKEPVKKISLIPEWIIVGILKRETQSYFDENGNIVYIDKSVGKCGEKGPFQMTYVAFKQIRKKGETHDRLMWDTAYAQDLAERYLLYKGPAKNSWSTTIRMYNGGQNNYLISDTLDYLNDVKKYGFKKNISPL
jgi:hypothetical protein